MHDGNYQLYWLLTGPRWRDDEGGGGYGWSEGLRSKTQKHVKFKSALMTRTSKEPPTERTKTKSFTSPGVQDPPPQPPQPPDQIHRGSSGFNTLGEVGELVGGGINPYHIRQIGGIVRRIKEQSFWCCTVLNFTAMWYRPTCKFGTSTWAPRFGES